MARALTKAQFDALRSILKREGQWTASGVLAVARRNNSPLHGLFEWEDAKAAHEYRLIQARQLRVVYNAQVEDPAERVVHVPVLSEEDGREGYYALAGDVVTDSGEWARHVAEVEMRLVGAQKAVDEAIAVAAKVRPQESAKFSQLRSSLRDARETLNRPV